MKINSQRKKQQQFHLVPQSIEYKNSHQPELSKEKKLAIQWKLKLEKEAIQQTKDRENDMNYYINYNYNPFIQMNGVETKTLIKMRNEPVKNLADKMTQMLAQPHKMNNKIQQRSANLQKIKLKNEKLSLKILNQIEKKNLFQKQKKLRQSSNQKDIKKTETQLNDLNKDQSDDRLSLENIQTISGVKEQNYYLRNNKVNIFKVVRDEDDEISGEDLLQKYHFCHSSMIQKMSKIKVPIYRDLSRLGRKSICGQNTSQNIIDFVDSFEFSYKINELIFNDVLSFASNRLSFDYLNRVINFQQTNKQPSDTSSLENQDTRIYYRKNQQNTQLNFINQNEEIQQIKDYKNLQSNETQLKDQKKYLRRKQHVYGQLELKKNLRSNTVKDKQLHREIGKGIQQTLKNFIQIDVPNVDADRMVRINKISKNRCEGLKLKNILQTLAYKNNYDQTFENSKK